MELIIYSKSAQILTVGGYTIAPYSSKHFVIESPQDFYDIEKDLKELKKDSLLDYDLIGVSTIFGSESFDPDNKVQRIQYDSDTDSYMFYHDSSKSWEEIKGSGFVWQGPSNPPGNLNPDDLYVLALNTSTGEIFVCMENTTDANVWIGQMGSVVFEDTTVLDVFGDGSCRCLYRLNGDAKDESGFYDGTENGTLTYPNDGIFQCLAPTTNTNIQVPFSIIGGTGQDMQSDWTFSALVKMGSIDTAPVLQFGGYVNNIALGVLNTGKFIFHGEKNDNRSWVESVQAASPGQWYHVIGVYDWTNQEWRIYVNGALDNTVAFPSGWYANSGGSEACIGAVTNGQTAIVSQNTSSPSPAYIDNVRVFAKALTDSEALTLYNHEKVI